MRRGFVRVHLAVDTMTGKMLSMEVTKEDVSPMGRILEPLVEEASSQSQVSKVIADWVYHSKETSGPLIAAGAGAGAQS